MSRALRTKPSTGMGATPVRVTLVCGWCARRVDDLVGLMETGTNRLRVMAEPGVGRSGRRLLCKHCGGPLFPDDWRPMEPAEKRCTRPPDTADDDSDGKIDRLVAA